MGTSDTVTINGVKYDTQTGMPIDSKPAKASTPIHHSSAMHAQTQKSTTLNRKSVKKHQPSPIHQNQAIKRRNIVATSPRVAKFAPYKPTVATQPTSSKLVSDIAPRRHPVAEKAHQKQMTHKTTPTHKPSQQIKHEVVSKALKSAKKPTHAKKSIKQRFPRALSIGSASLAVVLLGGYLTYVNIPTVSIHVAAVQAGIDASYPGYHPTGYKLSGPIAYSDGSVSMKFASNAGPQNFTVNEAKSSWDSTAVLENYVQPKAGEGYITYNDGGLTIYTYDNSAAWVNGGIMYTIEGNAQLSNDQVRKIATSL